MSSYGSYNYLNTLSGESPTVEEIRVKMMHEKYGNASTQLHCVFQFFD